METLHPEMIGHILEAAGARNSSVLFRQPSHWQEFNEWCRKSPVASELILRASGSIETFHLDRDSQLYFVYYVALSVETLSTIVKDLVEAYEDNVLDFSLAGKHR